jgi:hypothetical protein
LAAKTLKFPNGNIRKKIKNSENIFFTCLN